MDDAQHAALHEWEKGFRPEVGRKIARLIKAGMSQSDNTGVVTIPGMMGDRKIITVCEVRGIGAGKAAMEPLFMYFPDLASEEVELPPCFDKVHGMQAAATLHEIQNPGIQN